MKKETYILQGVSVVLMLAAILLGYVAVRLNNMPSLSVDSILFGANMVLFIWQRRIRNNLNRKR